MDDATLRRVMPQALEALDLTWPHPQTRGKVRDLFSLPPDRYLIVTTDRLSAFDERCDLGMVI